MTRNQNIIIIVKSWLLLHFSMQAGDFAQEIVNKFPVNIWFGRITGIIVTGAVGYFIYLCLFNEIEDSVNELTLEETQEIETLISSDEKPAKVIKKIREYSNLDLVKAKEKYDEMKKDLE